MKLTEANKELILDKIGPNKKVIISSHKGPDGDAIGSSTALALFVEQFGGESMVVVPDNFPDFLKWIPGNEKVAVYDKNPEAVEKFISESDIIFVLDYNDLKRVGPVGDLIANSNAPIVMIDHHEEPKDFATIMFHDAKCCSTAQLVYDFIECLDGTEKLNPEIAAGIYTGIVTDTGSFRFPSVNKRTHEIVAQLLELGFEHHKAHEALFDDNSINRLQLNGFAVSERLELLQNGQVAIIWLDTPDLKRFHAKKGDTEGLVNKALSISGVKMAAFFRTSDDIVKISFRSKGENYVNELARDNFSGGGHKYAAGGMSPDGIQAAITKFKSVVEAYL